MTDNAAGWEDLPPGAEHLTSKIKWLHEQRNGWEYIRFRLQEEKERAERYEHVFCIAFISAPDVTVKDLAEEIQDRIRGSDVICPVGDLRKMDMEGKNPEEIRPAVAVILPETGEKNAATACQRLADELNEDDVKIGFAVYPHDATAGGELLKLARMRQAHRTPVSGADGSD